ncbi:dihydropteroate synthase, partial [Phenoliferia sp. Uapishka_3]
MIDVGGMSTRPGAENVEVEEEINRVVPVILALRAEGITTPISIDTFRPQVARAAIAAGANIINDVMGGTNPGMLEAMVELDVPVVLMHSRGDPKTMGALSGYTHVGGVVEGVRKELGERVEGALKAGVKRWNVVVDPGVGFAKTGEDNLVLLKGLKTCLERRIILGEGGAEVDLGEYPSLVGLSRKKFLGGLTGKEVAKERDWATAAGVMVSIEGGADIVRVHEVDMGKDVCKVADAVYRNKE